MFYWKFCKNILLIANGRLPPKIQTVFFLNTKGSLWMDQKDFLEKLIIVAKRCWCRIIQEQKRVLNYKFLRRKKKKIFLQCQCWEMPMSRFLNGPVILIKMLKTEIFFSILLWSTNNYEVLWWSAEIIKSLCEV